MELAENKLYNCIYKNKVIGQIIKLSFGKVIFRYFHGLFSVFDFQEAMQQVEVKIDNCEKLDIVNELEGGYKEGVFEIDLEGISILCICFQDHTAAYVVENQKAYILWEDSKDMLRNIYRNKLLWLP